MSKNIRAIETIQAKLGDGLAGQVKRTVQALQHPTSYDRDTLTNFHVLCLAIEASAQHTSGTCVTLFGIEKALEDMRRAVEG